MFKCKMLFAAAALSSLSPIGAAESQAQGMPTFFAVLNGANECDNTAPPAGPICRKGDPDGYGSATVTMITATQLCVGLAVDNLAGVTLMHIHSGGATVNGPVVVSFVPPLAGLPNANPGTISGCVAGLPAAVVSAIRANPQLHYLNVHNAAFPAGAVRGQLF